MEDAGHKQDDQEALKKVEDALAKDPKTLHKLMSLVGGDLSLFRSEISERFSGPIPPPETLAKYNEIVPDAADRILSMAETQATHRQRLELTVVKSDKWHSLLGLILAFVLAAGFSVEGTYLIINGHSADGLVAMIVPLATLVGCFVYAVRRRKKELRERSGVPDATQSAEQLNLPFEDGESDKN
ncbi:MAG: DUF2335 domain-containing protein [Pseudomonadota bacterium]